jgi:hypothetical protein
MFKISSISQTYTTPVTVDVPDGKGGSVKHKFAVVFKRLPQDELDELHRRLNREKLQEGETLLSDDEVLDQVVTGWQDVLDQNDQPLEFNPENFGALKNVFPTRPTLVTAFFESIKTAKRKN